MVSRRVIDAHTHLFSPDVLANRERYVVRDYWFGELYGPPAARLATPEELLASMDASGIECSVVCGFPWSDPGICRQENDYLADLARNSGGRLAFMGMVVPHLPGASEEAERCFGLGAVAIGELNADAQGFDLLDPLSITPVMDSCRQAGKPVMLHSSEPVGHGYPGKGTATPAKFVHWLQTWKDQPVVLAHWGGGLPFYELMPEVRELTANVAYDSGASTYLYRQDVFRHVLNLVGPERVLFGSDFPVLGQTRLLNRVRRQFEDDPALDALLGGNAARIYGLSAET